ncbi:hypothetical protein [Paenibacillus sp. GCM10012306]|uniref:hypothetical protein n=1 Tax=Paenibacillus sp. GCM10012306 TaxID=3317342 RepID=UPI003607C8F1
MTLNKEDIELKLIANVPISIEGAPDLVLPSFRTVAERDLSKYYQYLSVLLINKDIFNKEFDDDRITNFDVFFSNCYHSLEFRELAFDGLHLFFLEEPTLHEGETDVSIKFSTGFINRNNFDDIQYILKLAHHIKNENKPEFKAANSKAQEMIDMIFRNRTKQPPKKEKIDLMSMATGLGWKSNGISIREVFDLSIYQIYNGFFSTNNIDNYEHTISGIYAGTIESKNIKLPDIHWANKIDN